MLTVCALPTSLLLQKEATKGRVFKIELSKVSGNALAAEICTGPHNRLLRRQHCSSLCSQSEGNEHVANMTSALGRVFKIASKSYAFFAYSIYAFDYQVRRKIFNRPFLNMAVSSILQPFFEVEVNSSVLVG